MLIKIVLLLTIVSWIYWVIAFFLVRAFFQESDEKSTFTPPVSILKAVKGLDEQAYENFASFCQQDYPEYEILFGVADPYDPVIPVIRQLQQDFSDRRIRLIVSEATQPNRKASLLHALANCARYDYLVASDSDMRVTPDYLGRVVAPLADQGTGLVTCTYRGEEPVTFTARLEALYMGVTFLPSVLAARQVLKMRFSLGATQALRRPDLERIGGFAAIADYLADDYQVGARISKAGLRVQLCDYIVTSILGTTTFVDQWNREVRWAHCTRISRPLEYPGLALSFSTPLAVTLLLMSWFQFWAWGVLLFSLILRWFIAGMITTITKDRVSRKWLVWLPVRDMLSALIWLNGLIGNKVTWRGEEFILDEDGRLIPVSSLETQQKWNWRRWLGD
ncbi:MAG: bacteriohopanetetrol glucosamine biosynthesis glycosyltransferase HpnI [Anaerolineales bacterium]|jgi:ceramide glucosyltransferase